MKILAKYSIIKKHIKPVVIQNSVSLVNMIFLAVTLLLVIFKEAHEALFLAVVLGLNIIIGIIQDLRAKIALEQLQILMTPRIIRINQNGAEENALLGDVKVDDTIKISLGDQIPADGRILESTGLEVNEALITGESDNIRKQQDDLVLAGSIVTAGSAVYCVKLTPHDSFVSKMTEKIKQYTVNLSPIQKTLNRFITYMSYLLLTIIIYVVVHGIRVHELLVSVVKDIAALTSTLVPQGLILATTVFFAYGAVRLLKKQVLLQEINATEKLGRIKNLCVDKTGTLTENKPVMENLVLYGNNTRASAEQLMDGYIQANKDTSETTKAIKATLRLPFTGPVIDSLPFSSERKYGAATLKLENKVVRIAVGAPDVLLNRLATEEQRQWLDNQVDLYARQAKRLVLLAEFVKTGEQPNLEQGSLNPLAMFILSNPLRPGTAEIISFFQNRGVRIRVISGDNPKTVQAIARLAGIKHSDLIVTGQEMELWDEEEYEERVPAYHLFARIKPDQKEKIIALLKTNGFTAMIGDGANDALAIKKADLGIAMFDGAGATRQIAEIILMNNSFAALRTGVDMAEVIITNIELVASIFFNKVAIGLFLFTILAVLGHTYPLSPRNTTVINYFAIWLPMIFWAIFPAQKQGLKNNNQSFLRKVLPFSLVCGALTALAAVTVFMLGPKQLQTDGSNILVVLTLTALGYWYFVLAPIAYGINVNKKQQKVLYLLAGLGAIFLLFAMFQPAMSEFFDLRRPAFWPLITTACITWAFGWLQYQITKRWFGKK